jgi:apolipoprotein D and lipocalin family protein
MNKRMKKLIQVGCVLAAATWCVTSAYANNAKVSAVEQVDLNKYLGEWHEVARKPLKFQKDCAYNVMAQYSLNDKGNVKVVNSCYKANGERKVSEAEAFVKNAPANSKLEVSFLPKSIRWLPVGRGDYWVLKLDPEYQMALVGEPSKKYLWVLSRNPQPDPAKVKEYLNYAQSLGYDLKDLIYTPYKAQ